MPVCEIDLRVGDPIVTSGAKQACRYGDGRVYREVGCARAGVATESSTKPGTRVRPWPRSSSSTERKDTVTQTVLYASAEARDAVSSPEWRRA